MSGEWNTGLIQQGKICKKTKISEGKKLRTGLNISTVEEGIKFRRDESVV